MTISGDLIIVYLFCLKIQHFYCADLSFNDSFLSCCTLLSDLSLKGVFRGFCAAMHLLFLFTLSYKEYNCEIADY